MIRLFTDVQPIEGIYISLEAMNAGQLCLHEGSHYVFLAWDRYSVDQKLQYNLIC